MFDFIKGLLNEETDVFRGGYAFWFDYNGFNLVKVNQEQLTVEDFEYTPISMPNEQETPHVEKLNRSDYTRIFQILIRVKDKDTPVTDSDEYLAIAALKAKLHLQTYVVDGKKVKFKCTNPQSRGVYTHASYFWAMFDIQITTTEIEEGYFSDEAVIEIRKVGGTYEELDWLEVVIPMGAESLPMHDVRTNLPPQEKVIRYTSSPNVSFYYRNTALEKELYDIQMGKGNTAQIYQIRITEAWHVGSSGVYEYDVKFVSGAPMYRKGNVTRVSLEARLA